MDRFPTVIYALIVGGSLGFQGPGGALFAVTILCFRYHALYLNVALQIAGLVLVISGATSAIWGAILGVLVLLFSFERFDRPNTLIDSKRFRLIWAFVGILTAIAFILQGDLSHFTWWSLLVFVIHSFSSVYGYGSETFYAFATVQTIVIVGVVLMSITQCRLLTDALSEHGSIVYFFGNFAMHYFPLALGVILEPTSVNFLNGVATGSGIFISYLSLQNPSDVYVCSSVERTNVALGLFFAWICVFIGYFLWNLGHPSKTM